MQNLNMVIFVDWSHVYPNQSPKHLRTITRATYNQHKYGATYHVGNRVPHQKFMQDHHLINWDQSDSVSSESDSSDAGHVDIYSVNNFGVPHNLHQLRYGPRTQTKPIALHTPKKLINMVNVNKPLAQPQNILIYSKVQNNQYQCNKSSSDVKTPHTTRTIQLKKQLKKNCPFCDQSLEPLDDTTLHPLYDGTDILKDLKSSEGQALLSKTPNRILQKKGKIRNTSTENSKTSKTATIAADEADLRTCVLNLGYRKINDSIHGDSSNATSGYNISNTEVSRNNVNGIASNEFMLGNDKSVLKENSSESKGNMVSGSTGFSVAGLSGKAVSGAKTIGNAIAAITDGSEMKMLHKVKEISKSLGSEQLMKIANPQNIGTIIDSSGTIASSIGSAGLMKGISGISKLSENTVNGLSNLASGAHLFESIGGSGGSSAGVVNMNAGIDFRSGLDDLSGSESIKFENVVTPDPRGIAFLQHQSDKTPKLNTLKDEILLEPIAFESHILRPKQKRDKVFSEESKQPMHAKCSSESDSKSSDEKKSGENSIEDTIIDPLKNDVQLGIKSSELFFNTKQKTVPPLSIGPYKQGLTVSNAAYPENIPQGKTISFGFASTEKNIQNQPRTIYLNKIIKKRCNDEIEQIPSYTIKSLKPFGENQSKKPTFSTGHHKKEMKIVRKSSIKTNLKKDNEMDNKDTTRNEVPVPVPNRSLGSRIICRNWANNNSADSKSDVKCDIRPAFGDLYGYPQHFT